MVVIEETEVDLALANRVIECILACCSVKLFVSFRIEALLYILSLLCLRLFVLGLLCFSLFALLEEIWLKIVGILRVREPLHSLNEGDGSPFSLNHIVT